MGLVLSEDVMHRIPSTDLEADRLDRPVRAANRGFSLLEVLVASTFLLVMILGVLPIFSRATISNMQSRDVTAANALARATMEEYVQIPFDDARLTVGAGTELATTSYLDNSTKTWQAYTTPDPPANASYSWLRTVTVRQFHISAIDDGELVTDVAAANLDALDASADSSNVHLKQVLIEVEKRSNIASMGRPRKVTINLVKSN